MQRILMILSSIAIEDTVKQHAGNVFFRSSVILNEAGERVENALIKVPTKALCEVIEKYGQDMEAIPFVMPLLTIVSPKSAQS